MYVCVCNVCVSAVDCMDLRFYVLTLHTLTELEVGELIILFNTEYMNH